MKSYPAAPINIHAKIFLLVLLLYVVSLALPHFLPQATGAGIFVGWWLTGVAAVNISYKAGYLRCMDSHSGGGNEAQG